MSYQLSAIAVVLVYSARTDLVSGKKAWRGKERDYYASLFFILIQSPNNIR